MAAFDRGKQRLFFLIAALGVVLILGNLFVLSGEDVRSHLISLPIPGIPKEEGQPAKPSSTTQSLTFLTMSKPPSEWEEPVDTHPIAVLMREADQKWKEYEEDRSKTFRETVSKYRRKYGRHPPPGFKEWYQFAREKNVYNIDDFEQIMDDLRPFWGVEPKAIRALAATLWEENSNGISGIHIRGHKIVNETNKGWRSETLVTLIEKFVEHLPDMDIAMNRLDQPRVVVPWEDMQELLAKERDSRQMRPEAAYEFTQGMDGFAMLGPKPENYTLDPPPEKLDFFQGRGKQYMDIAKKACPPESPARNKDATLEDSEKLYKHRLGGLVTNFNRSSDLCTVGPSIQEKHGFLYAATSVVATHKLAPIFGECKVNVNNDILFPANMYWKHDDRYDYDDTHDLHWDDKHDSVVWRGVTSGGVQLEDNWKRMHRQRLVQLLNGTEMQGKDVRILTEVPEKKGEYENFRQFQPSKFAEEHTDVGFTEAWGCIPNCDFYKDVWTLKPQVSLSEQFEYKYLVDVDGHSFSGRWRAFLESKSLGIKATVFREWHDSRLFAWRHFVPMDNKFDDIYTLLTYFIGLGRPGQNPQDNYANGEAYVSRHDIEGKKIANQGREWAGKVLRRDDIEIYTFRLLLEYGRIIDDNRDQIGYFGDGGELDKYDGKKPTA
ncbi:MAG: hypothetical protein M1819_000379 [Sarea resinae]|nr:MAG: hypothetical protein M1819_000379 [Sarea resinae]